MAPCPNFMRTRLLAALESEVINRSRSSTPRFLAGKHRKQEDSTERNLGATNSRRVPLRRQSLMSLMFSSIILPSHSDVFRMNEKSSVDREMNVLLPRRLGYA